MNADGRTVDYPVTGNFDSAALASARRIDPAQWASDAPLLGLVRESGYVWGTVRDDDGNIFSVMRRIPPRVEEDEPGEIVGGEKRALGGRLVVLSTLGPAGEALDAMCIRREPKNAVHSEHLRREARPDGVRYDSEGAEGAAMLLDLTTESMVYREEGVLDVAGNRVCPALQWYVPGPEAALLYLTQTWEVEGTLLGRSVRGFMFWEEAYMKPGARLYVEKDPLHDADYTSWYSWATKYDDGVTEVGHFLIGGHAFGVGVVASSTGEVASARRVTGTVNLTPDGQWHAGIDYDLDGVAWRCEPDPKGHMHLGPMPNPQQEGRIFRNGETRTPVLHMAWGESVTARVRGE
ncbi:hypothetical protein [Streptomyces gilvus]|uniref:hypothetical protein n=1 Tax=Streptomyces gilvus TaxID=2920937 RepID=UPI001F1163EB|nr:hypothetical protein [Streptomyces sp. CME 23]MCH5675641.1 hypothetical protein [Streptomyces sp. CME 23]